MEGRSEGERREFSREQHFPTVWGFDTWLSHIPQPCSRPSTGTQGKEGESERGRFHPESSRTIWGCGRQGVCVCVCMCVVLTCLSYGPAFHPVLAAFALSAGREMRRWSVLLRFADRLRLFYSPVCVDAVLIGYD